LQLRNDKGTYDHHMPPDMSSSAAIGEYIQTRTAAWTQHLQRRRKRRQGRKPAKKKVTRNAGKKSSRKKRR
jgi:hypothetical protein